MAQFDSREAERLVNTYSDLILRLSYTYLKSTSDAEDICQTVFLKLPAAERRFENPAHEKAWIIRAAVNACKDELHPSAAETEIIDKIGRPIGASASDNGVTVTADAIIGDKYHCAVVYTIARDDGQPFDVDLDSLGTSQYLPLGFENCSTYWGRMGGSHGTSYFYDADPADNAIQYVELWETDSEIPHGTAKASFENLVIWRAEERQYTVAEGKWELSFAMDFEDASVSLPAGQTIALGDMRAVIDEITLSPVALRVDYTVDSEVQWEDAPSGRMSEYNSEQSRNYLENLEITVNMKDGSALDMTNAGGSIRPGGGVTVCQKGDVFERIISLEEVSSVTVAGVEIPLS